MTAGVAVEVGVALAMGVLLYVEAILLTEAPQARQHFSWTIVGRPKGLYTAAWGNSVFRVARTLFAPLMRLIDQRAERARFVPCLIQATTNLH